MQPHFSQHLFCSLTVKNETICRPCFWYIVCFRFFNHNTIHPLLRRFKPLFCKYSFSIHFSHRSFSTLTWFYSVVASQISSKDFSYLQPFCRSTRHNGVSNSFQYFATTNLYMNWGCPKQLLTCMILQCLGKTVFGILVLVKSTHFFLVISSNSLPADGLHAHITTLPGNLSTLSSKQNLILKSSFHFSSAAYQWPTGREASPASYMLLRLYL